MGHQISEAEARERVMKVNNTLREAGKTWEEIEAFWQDCINQAKANNAGAQNFGNTPGDMILVEIIRIHIDDSILDENGKPDVAKIDPLARLGGRKYASLNEAWDIIRPN